MCDEVQKSVIQKSVIPCLVQVTFVNLVVIYFILLQGLVFGFANDFMCEEICEAIRGGWLTGA